MREKWKQISILTFAINSTKTSLSCFFTFFSGLHRIIFNKSFIGFSLFIWHRMDLPQSRPPLSGQKAIHQDLITNNKSNKFSIFVSDEKLLNGEKRKKALCLNFISVAIRREKGSASFIQLEKVLKINYFRLEHIQLNEKSNKE